MKHFAIHLKHNFVNQLQQNKILKKELRKLLENTYTLAH